MTKEELYTKYTEQVQAKAKEFVDSQLADVRMFMKEEQLEETAVDMYNIYISGANAARDVLVALFSQYAKEIKIKDLD